MRAEVVQRAISKTNFEAYRARTYRQGRGQQLGSADEAVDYVGERGFVYFWPIKGVDLPSLWAAVAGRRPVADKHDDPGHVTWGNHHYLKHVFSYGLMGVGALFLLTSARR